MQRIRIIPVTKQQPIQRSRTIPVSKPRRIFWAIKKLFGFRSVPVDPIPSVPQPAVVLGQDFQAFMGVNQSLDDDASIAVAGCYKPSETSDNEITIKLQLTVQPVYGQFTQVIFEFKLLDPLDPGESMQWSAFHPLIRTPDIQVTGVHPIDVIRLDEPVSVSYTTEFGGGANLNVGSPGVPANIGANVTGRQEKSYTIPEYPSCSATLIPDQALCRWVLQGKKGVTRGVTGRIPHMAVKIKLPPNLSPRHIQAGFWFKFDYIPDHKRKAFPSPNEYRMLTLDLGSSKSKD